MPLPLIPLILGGAALCTAGFGVKKGLDAKSNFSEASSITEDARRTYDKAKDALESVREETQQELVLLGEQKVALYTDALLPFVDAFLEIKNIDFTDPNLAIDKDMVFTETDLAEIAKISLQMADVLAGGAAALGGGALAGIGAFGGAGLLATASTGTAISSLAGAAATNATLAWFGGGALAAGGLGMAGGAIVLGGIVAAPVLAVGGFLLASKSQAALTDAYSNKSKAEATAEAMKAARTAARSILRRTEEIRVVLSDLTTPFQDMVEDLRDLVQEDTDYSKYSEREKNIVRNSAAFAVTAKNILETPIINEQGVVTQKSREVLKDVRNFLEKVASM